MKTPLLLLTVAVASLWAGDCKQYDFVVYGGSAAGMAAAVSASRNGLKTALVEPGQHIGGMVTGGLSHSDIGEWRVIGGLSREFFDRTGKKYGKDVTWNFEPKVAEQVMREMLAEAKVDVFFGEQLVEYTGVTRKDGRIVSFTTNKGASYCAATFADATYEGDLMDQAGVEWTWGRESTTDYNEPLAGARGKQRRDHHFNYPVSPYDSQNRLLPEVHPQQRGAIGTGDKKVQAYNFRMCLSDAPANMVAFPKPANYDPWRYELLRRQIDSLIRAHGGRVPKLTELLIISPLPNHKFDINNFGGMSTDHIGANWDYPTGSYARRAEIWQDHIDYQMGLFYFLANDARLPAEVRAAMNRYGLAKDEFVDTKNWPNQLYVREARRMVGVYVIRQKDIQDEITKPDSIGMGSYQSDSHHVDRNVQADGTVDNEGEMYVPTKPYQIPYRILLAKRGQADNLLVPVCFSATHVAYSTVRMEPQYMILGHAAGAAAALAKKSGKPLHDIDTAELQRVLTSQRAVLSFNGKSTATYGD